MIEAWRKDYNEERSKKSLGGLTPGIGAGEYKVDSQAREALGVASPLDQRGSWIQRVIGLLDIATQQLESSQEAAQAAIEQATALLQEQMQSRSKEGARAAGGLLAWQVHKVGAYVDAHIVGRMLVSELSAIVQLSPAHFSRSFKQAFGLSPHAFVLRRRLAHAVRLMLESTKSLAVIAQHCGLTDQAHLCRQFKRVMGESPAAWRRARRCRSVERIVDF